MKLRKKSENCRAGIDYTYMGIRRIIFIVTLLFFAFHLLLPTQANAEHQLHSQQIHVKIHKDGSADIIDQRQVHLDHGTENFIVIGNLGKSKIKHFTVSENGEEYTYEKDWDIDATREDKKFKYGIVDKGKEYELCWGIGEFGYHEYIVKYTITNFIKGLKDGQMLFWKFVNDDQDIPPEKMKVIIEADQPLNLDEDDIWAFGYSGTFKVTEGKAIAESSQPLTSEDYTTLLMRFPENTFNTEEHVNKTFKKIQKKAFKNSDFSNKKPWIVTEVVYPILFILGSIALFWIGVFIFALLFGKFFKRKFEGEYCREFPYEGHFLAVDYIRKHMRLDDNKTKMNALILKWLKEGKIELLKGKAEGVVFKREATDLQFLSRKVTKDMNGPERELFRLMLSAANENNVLREEDFTAWARKHYSKLNSWSYKTWQYSTRKLIAEGYLKKVKKKTLFITSTELKLTDKGEELEKQLYKFINYLHDFSLINEREAVEVKVWEELMIWASFLEQTEVVREQFAKLHPDIQSEHFFSYVSDTNAFTSRVDSASSSGSSSSSAGGGGSYGGGSGGGTR